MVSRPDVESPANPRVRAWRSLRDRSARSETGLFLLEGEREVMRAIGTVEIIESIIRMDRSDIVLPSAVYVSSRVFDRISARQNADGIAAVARIPDLGLGNLVLQEQGLVLVGDGIEKPGNVGAMIRSADAFGALFIGSALRTDLVNPNVVRSAQGSLFAGGVASCDRSDAIAWCEQRTTVVLAVPEGGVAPWEIDLTGPTSFVIGSEHAGISAAWLGHGLPVTIPTTGTADSLNASVAAAVLLAEATRQRST